MIVEPKQVENYVTLDNKAPYEEWLDSLTDREGRNKIDIKITRLRTGNLGKCRAVGEGVTELKIDFGPGYRVYFGQDGTTLVILLCGGDKDTQDQDIKTAKEYWADYKSRKPKGKRNDKAK